MPKTSRAHAYSVEVEPRRLGDLGSVSMSDCLLYPDEAERLEAYRKRCVEIVEQIKQHVDCIGGIAINTQMEDVCEYCGRSWTEDGDEYNGGCCPKDFEHEPSEDEDPKHKKTYFVCGKEYYYGGEDK